MSGRLSTLGSIFYQLALILAAFASGIISEYLSPRQIFFLMAGLAASIGLFGLWKARSVLGRTCDQSLAGARISSTT